MENDKTGSARRKLQSAAVVTITAETDSIYLDTPGQSMFVIPPRCKTPRWQKISADRRRDG
jgi:hypothetical protein